MKYLPIIFYIYLTRPFNFENLSESPFLKSFLKNDQITKNLKNPTNILHFTNGFFHKEVQQKNTCFEILKNLSKSLKFSESKNYSIFLKTTEMLLKLDEIMINSENREKIQNCVQIFRIFIKKADFLKQLRKGDSETNKRFLSKNNHFFASIGVSALLQDFYHMGTNFRNFFEQYLLFQEKLPEVRRLEKKDFFEIGEKMDFFKVLNCVKGEVFREGKVLGFEVLNVLKVLGKCFVQGHKGKKGN